MSARLTPYRPHKLGLQADMSPMDFRKMIHFKGLNVQWEQAMACPCRQALTVGIGAEALDGTTNSRRHNCDGCGGSGWLYHSKQPIVVLITSAEHNPKMFAHYGVHAPGSARLTFLPENIPGFMDRIVATDDVVVYSTVQERKGTVDRLAFPVVTRTVMRGSEADPRVPETVELGVIHARRTTTAGLLVGDELVDGVDFELSDDGAEVDWSLGIALGTAPAEEATWAMVYHTHPVYLITGFPHGFRDTWVKFKKPDPERANLPVLASARLAWLDSSGPEGDEPAEEA
jgi:hypothetical protein